MKSTYIYPAIFNYADDGISIEFPDLPGCYPCADNEDKAFHNAKEALGLHIYGMEQDGEEIPAPTPANKVKPSDGDVVTLIEVFMPPLRDRINNQFVKKTLSIPAWLNHRAEKEKVNFSRILQDGLKSYLQIAE